MPTGNLREYKYNLKRADILIFTNADTVYQKITDQYNKYTENIYSSQSKLNQLIDIEFKTAGLLSTVKIKPLLALAGIAHPVNFKNALIDAGIDISAFQSFPDHYPFKLSDLEEMIEFCRDEGCQTILCTEKDLVKIARLEGLKEKLTKAGIQLFGVRLELELEQPDQLVKNIKTMLDNTG